MLAMKGITQEPMNGENPGVPEGSESGETWFWETESGKLLDAGLLDKARERQENFLEH